MTLNRAMLWCQLSSGADDHLRRASWGIQNGWKWFGPACLAVDRGPAKCGSHKIASAAALAIRTNRHSSSKGDGV